MNQETFLLELDKLGIQLTDNQLYQLQKYYELLVEYNQYMNLTGITEKEDVYLKHFYDSITLVKAVHLEKINTLCDIGTGAGFPGLVLKIVFPNINVTLVDSLNKRIEFLKVVIEKLGLENIEVVHARAEEYAITHRENFDVVTSRAVANLSLLSEYSIPMVKKHGYFIPMKSHIEEEIISIDKALSELNAKLIEVISFELPKENSLRNLIKIQKLDKTKTKYPRKYSEMKKKPL